MKEIQAFSIYSLRLGFGRDRESIPGVPLSFSFKKSPDTRRLKQVNELTWHEMLPGLKAYSDQGSS